MGKKKLAEKIADKGSLEYVKNKIERCLIPRLPDDVWGVICKFEENPWEIIKRIDDGICPKYTPLHFIGEYKVDSTERWDRIKDKGYNIKSLESVELSEYDIMTSIPELSETLESLDLEDLSRLTTIPELPESLQSLKLRNLEDLTTIPELPKGLHTLELDGLYTTLPELPKGLLHLELVGRGLRLDGLTLPVLPKGLQSLKLIDLELTTIPELPKGLRTLELFDLPSLTNIIVPHGFDVNKIPAEYRNKVVYV